MELDLEILVSQHHDPAHKFRIFAITRVSVGEGCSIYPEGKLSIRKVMVEFRYVKNDSKKFAFPAIEISFGMVAAMTGVRDKMQFTIRVELFDDNRNGEGGIFSD